MNQSDVESWKIKLEDLEDRIKKEQFYVKLDIRSLDRKLLHYKEKLNLVKDYLEQEQVEDIIEKILFDQQMMERETDRKVRALKLEIFEIYQLLNSD